MSTEYIVEVLQLPVNETFTASPELWTELREGAARGGISFQEWGLTIEDKNKLYWVLHFETGVTPKTFFKTPAEKEDLVQRLKAIASGPPKSHYASLKAPFPKEIMNAPVTEIGLISLKPGIDKVAVAKGVDAFIYDFIAKNEGAHGALWAYAAESPVATAEELDTVIIFVGTIPRSTERWPSRRNSRSTLQASSPSPPARLSHTSTRPPSYDCVNEGGIESMWS